VLINYGVIALLIAQELGTRILDSFN
jgi:hypothetical protein